MAVCASGIYFFVSEFGDSADRDDLCVAIYDADDGPIYDYRECGDGGTNNLGDPRCDD